MQKMWREQRIKGGWSAFPSVQLTILGRSCRLLAALMRLHGSGMCVPPTAARETMLRDCVRSDRSIHRSIRVVVRRFDWWTRCPRYGTRRRVVRRCSPRSGPRGRVPAQTIRPFCGGGVVLCHGTLDSAAVASAHARCAHSYKLTSKLHGMCSAGLARTD